MKRVNIAFLVLAISEFAWAAEEPPAPAIPRERHVVVMPTAGLWNHTFRDSDFTAKVGPFWGLAIVVDPLKFLNVRGGVEQGNQPLSMKQGALSDEYGVYQPTLDIMRMHMRVEPTYRYTEQLKFYVGLGLGWSRLVVPEAETTPTLISYERTGTFLGYEAALGAAVEPIRNWLVIDGSLGASYLGQQRGSAFQRIQAFTEDGHRTMLDGLSRFGIGYRLSLGIGLVL